MKVFDVEVPFKRRLNRNAWAVAFTHLIATYGKWRKGKNEGKYAIHIHIPALSKSAALYTGRRKPWIKSPLLVSILLFIPWLVINFLLFGVAIVLYCTFSFYLTTLFQKSWINTRHELISGIVMFLFSLVGIYVTVTKIISYLL